MNISELIPEPEETLGNFIDRFRKLLKERPDLKIFDIFLDEVEVDGSRPHSGIDLEILMGESVRNSVKSACAILYMALVVYEDMGGSKQSFLRIFATRKKSNNVGI